MVEINRVWLNVDTDTNKITLFGRPRVSIHVDEYIWSLIEEHIVQPHKLMRSEKHGYLLKIAFNRFDSVRHRYYPLSPYNGPLREGVRMVEKCRSRLLSLSHSTHQIRIQTIPAAREEQNLPHNTIGAICPQLPPIFPKPTGSV